MEILPNVQIGRTFAVVPYYPLGAGSLDGQVYRRRWRAPDLRPRVQSPATAKNGCTTRDCPCVGLPPILGVSAITLAIAWCRSKPRPSRPRVLSASRLTSCNRPLIPLFFDLDDDHLRAPDSSDPDPATSPPIVPNISRRAGLRRRRVLAFILVWSELATPSGGRANARSVELLELPGHCGPLSSALRVRADFVPNGLTGRVGRLLIARIKRGCGARRKQLASRRNK